MTSRREILKGGLLAAVGLAVVGLAGPATATTTRKLLGKVSGSGTQARVSLSSLGKQVSVSEAGRMASFPISVPGSLPAGTSFADGRITSDGNMLSLLYTNGSMKPLGLYDGGAVMAIFQVKEDVIHGPPAFLPASFERVSVNGYPGFGRGPSNDGQPGQLQWWSGGRRVSILANLSVPELLGIARSMGDPQ